MVPVIYIATWLPGFLESEGDAIWWISGPFGAGNEPLVNTRDIKVVVDLSLE